MSFGDKCLSIAQDVREVVEISEHTSVRAGSLECDATEVRGVLRNSGAGVPRDLGVGAIIGAEELRYAVSIAYWSVSDTADSLRSAAFHPPTPPRACAL